MDFDTRDGLTLGGLVCLAIGFGMIALPLAFLTVGAFLFHIGYLR